MEPFEEAASTTPTPKWKIALIPILAATLIWNLSGSGTGSSNASPEFAAEDTNASVSSGAARLDSLVESLPPWPQFSLEQLVKHDPFALNGELKSLTSKLNPTVASELDEGSIQPTGGARMTLDELSKKNPVTAVIDGPRGRAAIIDSRIVRVGDVLEDGIRVVGIQKSGVIVEITN